MLSVAQSAQQIYATLNKIRVQLTHVTESVILIPSAMLHL